MKKSAKKSLSLSDNDLSGVDFDSSPGNAINVPDAAPIPPTAPPVTPNPSTQNPSSSGVLSTSAKKLYGTLTSDDSDTKTDEISPCYLFIDTELLSNFLIDIVSCNICSSNVVVKHKLDLKQGFAHNISIECSKDSCTWSKSFWTSKKVKTPKGRPPFDVNMRSIIAFREIGKGLTAIKKFGGCMNMPNVLNQTAYAGLVTSIKESYTKVAKACMVNAANQIRVEKQEDVDDRTLDIDISADGAWQRRGFASLNGVVTIIGVDVAKCIDYEVLTKVCKACQVWESKKGTLEYHDFMSSHECPINHHGSASSMEPSGVLTCFKRSLSDYNLRYTSYIGDGDSSSFSSLYKADPYDGVPITKKECVGHVQK